jgi:SAM-dependent methyltransferase
MNYIDTNKAAWEEAFEHRLANWGDDNYLRLRSEKFAFFDSDMKELVASLDLQDKDIAQFCCNNGRELLSMVLDGQAASGTGFDIAQNILAQAQLTADKAGVTNCEFVLGNILEIPESFHGRFDVVFFTIGALCWFQNLTELFAVASKCLKKNGTLIINDGHPVANMLALPGDEEYNPDNPKQFAFSYFRQEPWINDSGMHYMSGEYESKPFTDFSHTISEIINALYTNELSVTRFDEYDYELGNLGTDAYNGTGLPLSYILVAQKR